MDARKYQKSYWPQDLPCRELTYPAWRNVEHHFQKVPGPVEKWMILPRRVNHPGVIILPTQTRHYYSKGNPSKLPYILYCLIPPKNGKLNDAFHLIAVWHPIPFGIEVCHLLPPKPSSLWRRLPKLLFAPALAPFFTVVNDVTRPSGRQISQWFWQVLEFENASPLALKCSLNITGKQTMMENKLQTPEVSARPISKYPHYL